MTIRSYLTRRWKRYAAIAILLGVGFIVSGFLGTRGNQTLWEIAVFLGFAMFLVLFFVLPFSFRCPRCRVFLGGPDWGRRLESNRRSFRFNYCPGCGIGLDTELS